MLKLNIQLTELYKIIERLSDSIKKIFAGNNTFICRSKNLLLLVERNIITFNIWVVSDIQPINRKIYGGNIQVINKPIVIVNYNKYMEGIKQADS